MWLGRLAHFQKLLALRPKPYLHLHAMGKQPSYIILTLNLQARRIFTYIVAASIFHRIEMWIQFWTGLSASNRLKSARRPRRMYAARAFQVIAITSKTHAAYMWLGRLAHFQKLLALRPFQNRICISMPWENNRVILYYRCACRPGGYLHIL